MQSFQDGGGSSKKTSEHVPNLTHFLYDGLLLAAQDLLQKSNLQLHSAIGSQGSTLFADFNILPWLRSFSRTKIFLSIVWIFVLWWGEKRVFYRHISVCHWENWEAWVGPLM